MKPTDAEPKIDPQVRCDDLLAELDALYVKFRATQHTAIWGGSWEREHAAQMDIKPVVNKMFDTLIKLMEIRSEHQRRNDLCLTTTTSPTAPCS
jgi:hypothetical protein